MIKNLELGKLSWVIQRAPCNHWGPYKKKGHNREGDRRTAAEVGMICFEEGGGGLSRECGRPLVTRKDKGMILPRASGRNVALPTL